MSTFKVYATAVAAGALLAGSASAGNSVDKPTYAKDVAQIMNQNCAGCHSPGQIAPMSLLSYDEVRPWVKSIQKHVEAKSMPPWHGDDGYGPFTRSTEILRHRLDNVNRHAFLHEISDDRHHLDHLVS